MSSETPRLSVEGLTKRFGSVTANDTVSFDVMPGELHCLLGENGAGKSTLLGCIFGRLAPDAGRILIDGKHVTLRSPADAALLGIAVVQQHFVLIPRFTVLENVTLGARAAGIRLRPIAAAARLTALMQDLAIPLDLSATVETLSVGEQQWVEILKALYLDAKLLLLDEPTAVLTPEESVRLFAMIGKVTSRGVAVVLISHKFDEVMQADRVTVLRQGRTVTTVRPADTTRAALATLMVGRNLSTAPTRATRPDDSPPMLEIKNLTLPGRLDPINFSIGQGEILGIAGVAGNGQDELFEVLSGSRAIPSGDILLDGKSIGGLAPPAIARQGVGYVPSDRYRDGLIGGFSIADNLILGQQHEAPYARFGMLDRGCIERRATEEIAAFNIMTATVDLAARRLSGGNAQKLILARELRRATKCLLCHQPSRGLDIGVIDYVHRQILAKRAEGCAILLASEDLDELFDLSDRIMVLFRGQIMGTLVTEETDRQSVGLLMAGHGMP
jgi:simple sugar transport system ATP-binding protein